MARTEIAPETPTTTPAPPPEPSTQEQARPSPVLAWPAEWPVPELPEQQPRRRARGLPMAPVLAGAGNTTTLATTAAYSAGGPAAAAAAGVVIAAGATAALLRRRATVRRGVSARAGGAGTLKTSRSGGGSGLRGGSSAGSGRGGSGSGRSGGGARSGLGSGSRGGLRRSGASPSGGSSRGGLGGGRHGGLLGKGSGRHAGPGRHTLGKHDGRGDSKRKQRKAQAATEKAAKKAIKQAAKDLAAKSSKPGKSQGVKAAAGRAARAAYNAGCPLVTRAAKAIARGARRARGVLVDGLCALAAGAWTLLGRGWKAAAARLAAVWKRRRAKRNTPTTPDSPTVAATVRRPAHTIPATLTGGTTMAGGGHHFVAPAMELARAAAHYQPTGMLQVGADFAGLEEALRLHAEAMKITVENADATQPLHPNIVEIMRQIHGLQLKAAELASELQPAFRSLHDVDIARLENPRKGVAGERMWDVSANL
ncbi:hypothetical protein ACGFNY_05010 [Streptomyces chartreusis]|uniref:hypothetical protein n=1 Tax=Streptomyces chartreusis TaxID=1969 RepID=UPI00371EB145